MKQVDLPFPKLSPAAIKEIYSLPLARLATLAGREIDPIEFGDHCGRYRAVNTRPVGAPLLLPEE